MPTTAQGHPLPTLLRMQQEQPLRPVIPVPLLPMQVLVASPQARQEITNPARQAAAVLKTTTRIPPGQDMANTRAIRPAMATRQEIVMEVVIMDETLGVAVMATVTTDLDHPMVETAMDHLRTMEEEEVEGAVVADMEVCL